MARWNPFIVQLSAAQVAHGPVAAPYDALGSIPLDHGRGLEQNLPHYSPLQLLDRKSVV